MRTFTLSLGIAIALAGSATAQGMSIGQYEFDNSCAVCHGTTGKGDGEFSRALTTAPPDLTILQKNNGGVFPFQRVYDTIDGSSVMAAHGSRDMPIWGMRYAARTANSPHPFSPDESETFARGRILALIEYISTLQAK